MTKTEQYIAAILFAVTFFWGCNSSNKASKYESKYLENQYILDIMKANHPEVYPMIEEAKYQYNDIGADHIGDNQATGLDN